MKDVVINKSLNILNNSYNYDNDTFDRVKYGLELLYISITKMIVILGISIIFNLLKETLLVILFSNGLRTFAYGIHAKKSWHCHISSITVFVILPFIFKSIYFSVLQKIIISIVCLISFALFAPADTHKRPLINKNHRKKLKIKTLLISLTYVLIIFVSSNVLVNNMIILSMIVECFAINPIIYKLCGMPYNNYMSYQSK